MSKTQTEQKTVSEMVAVPKVFDFEKNQQLENNSIKAVARSYTVEGFKVLESNPDGTPKTFEIYHKTIAELEKELIGTEMANKYNEDTGKNLLMRNKIRTALKKFGGIKARL